MQQPSNGMVQPGFGHMMMGGAMPGAMMMPTMSPMINPMMGGAMINPLVMQQANPMMMGGMQQFPQAAMHQMAMGGMQQQVPAGLQQQQQQQQVAMGTQAMGARPVQQAVMGVDYLDDEDDIESGGGAIWQ